MTILKKIPLVTLFCFCLHLQGQQYNFAQYSVAEGLAQSQVYAMCQAKNGYLWFGTRGGGLSRFDGRQFKHFSTKEGLVSNTIYSIYEDEQQHLWIGTQRGLCRFDGHQFEEIKRGKHSIPRVESILQNSDSTLVIGSSNGILEYNSKQKTIQQISRNPLLRKSIVHKIDSFQNQLWIATNRGLFIQGEKDYHFSESDILKGNEVLDFLVTDSMQVWVASYQGGLSKINFSNLEKPLVQHFPNTKTAKCLFKNKDGQIWVGIEEKGLLLYDEQDNKWTKINKRAGLPNNNVTSIIKDAWNNIWVGTSGGGVAKFLGRLFVHYDKDNGLHGNRIYALANTPDSSLLFTASSAGIGIRDSLSFQKNDIDSNFINVKAKAILQDKQSRLWVGTIGKGLLLFDTLGRRIFHPQNGFPDKEIISLVEDDIGNIWAGLNYEGIAKITLLDSTDYEVKYWNRSSGLKSQRLTQVVKDPAGDIWFATRLGELGYFKEDKIQRIYRDEAGLENDISIRSIAFDSTGHIWIGTAGNGVLKSVFSKEDLQFEPITLRQELSSFNIYFLKVDKDGNIWAGNERGVDKLTINETGVVSAVDFYGRNEGFLGIETCQNAAVVDHKGHLWFGTMNGLTQHIPSAQQIKKSAPNIHFEAISLFYAPLRETKYQAFATTNGIKKGLQLPYHQNSLSFGFKGIHLGSPDNIRYQWQLEGAEKKWSPLSTKQSVDYSNLPPGQYRFQVKAVSEQDLESPIIEASFEILQPFWQWWWVRLLGVTSVLLLIGLILWNWKKRVQKREALKRQQLETQNHILQLEQKALQLQMNPHFIFNALNSIQGLVATKNFREARSEINNFADLMRHILSNSRQEKITLQAEIDTLKQYLQIEQFCQRVEFDYDFDVNDDIDNNFDLDEVLLPPMLIQPFVENAIIHGISHLSQKGHILIQFQIKKNILECTIEDNGVGRVKAASLRQSKSPGHQSVAMSVTKERLEALRKGQTYQALEIVDLHNEQGAAQGTKVILRLPIETSF